MSLEHAILGFLQIHPYSGYDLKKVIDRTISHFKTADQSKIYRSLNTLISDGWATVEVIEQSNRPNRKVYHITPAGKVELRNWLTTPLPITELRKEYLVQVFFAGQLDDTEIITLFERMISALHLQIVIFSQLAQLAKEDMQEMASPRDAFFFMLVLEHGTSFVKLHLEWAEKSLERVRSGQLPQLTSPPGAPPPL